MKKYLKYLAPIFLLLLSVVTYKSWLTGAIFVYSDWPFYPLSALISNGQFSSWAGWASLGYFDNLTLWRKPIQVLYSIFAQYGYGKDKADIFLVFLPIIILNPLISYGVFYKTSKSALGSLVASFIFNFNTYFLSINTQGHLYLTISSSLVLLGLYLFISYLKAGRYVSIGILSFISLAIAVIDIRSLYLLFCLIFLYAAYNLFIFNPSTNKVGIIKMTLGLVYIVATAIVLNAFWFFVQLQSTSLLTNSITSRGMILDRFYSISKAVALAHPFWTEAGVKWFTINLIPFQFWFVPLLVFSVFLFDKTKLNIFFGLVAIVGLILSKQSSGPFIHLYETLFKFFPGFNAFREASKFYFITIVGYSFLSCSFIHMLESEAVMKRRGAWLKYVVVAITIFILAYNTRPYLTGEIKSLMVPSTMPSEYKNFNKQIISQQEFGRTLWLPTDTKWVDFSNLHPKISMTDTLYKEWSSLTPIKQGVTEQHITDFLKSEHFERVLSNSSVRYVSFPIDQDLNEYYKTAGLGDVAYYGKLLDRITFLKKTNVDSTNLSVYINNNSRPHIYITKAEETVLKGVPYDMVHFQQLTPTEYTIKVNSASKPFYLNFSESYHPGWRIRVGNFSWVSSLFKTAYDVDDSFHTISDIGLNSFYIDPQVLCQKFHCTDNTDGTVTINITLYFSPQAYMYLGLLVGIVSGIGILLSVVYIGSKKKND